MFEDRLKKMRESRGWTQKQVAESLEMNPRTYSSYENNEREPNSRILILIADLFGVSIDYLLGFDETQILKQDLGGRTSKNLTSVEIRLINDYRELSYQGKKYIQTTMNMCKSHFIKDESEKYTDDTNLSIVEQFQKAKPNKVAAYGKGTSSNIE